MSEQGQQTVLGKRPHDSPVALAEQSKRVATPAQSETVFRLLVNARRVGAVLGKGGSIVKQIRDETGGRIRVVDAVPGCEERVVVISSKNDTQELNSAQRALFLVHKRVIEGEEPMPASAAGGPAGITSRMLVCHSQAGSLIGKAGKIIKDMRETTGAHIKILSPEELPPCALSNDRIVQMVGTEDQLAQALALVSNQVRENPPKERPGGAPPTLHLQAFAGGPPQGGPPFQPYGSGPPPPGRY